MDLGPEGLRGVEERSFTPPHDLRTVRGTLQGLTAPERYSEDYVYAELTDEEALTDPIGALRITYPNLIGMRVRNSRTNDGLAQADAEVEAAEKAHAAGAFHGLLRGPEQRRAAGRAAPCGDAAGDRGSGGDAACGPSGLR